LTWLMSPCLFSWQVILHNQYTFAIRRTKDLLSAGQKMHLTLSLMPLDFAAFQLQVDHLEILDQLAAVLKELSQLTAGHRAVESPKTSSSSGNQKPVIKASSLQYVEIPKLNSERFATKEPIHLGAVWNVG